MSLNNCIFRGRLTRDPELRTTQSGTTVANFTLAVDRDFKPEGGERKADFIDCVAWAGRADFISRYFHKGSAAIVRGRLEIHTWEDDNGNKRKSAEINVDDIWFGESKRDNSNQQLTTPAPYPAPAEQYGGLYELPPEPGYDDLFGG